MKGSAVPALVALFAITIVMGGFSFGVVTDKAKGIFNQVGQEKNSIWVKDTLKPTIIDMCQQSGTQSPKPSGNFTQNFPGIKSMKSRFDTYTGYDNDGNAYDQDTLYNVDFSFKYEGTSQKVIIASGVTDPACNYVNFNGTEPDGTKISWGNKIDLESDSLNLRVFETSPNNITVQVRQD